MKKASSAAPGPSSLRNPLETGPQRGVSQHALSAPAADGAQTREPHVPDQLAPAHALEAVAAVDRNTLGTQRLRHSLAGLLRSPVALQGARWISPSATCFTCAGATRLKAMSLTLQVCQGSSIGSSSTPLPKCYPITSVPLKRYALGKRTAWASAGLKQTRRVHRPGLS